MAGNCAHVSGSAGSMKGEMFLDRIDDYQLLKYSESVLDVNQFIIIKCMHNRLEYISSLKYVYSRPQILIILYSPTVVSQPRHRFNICTVVELIERASHHETCPCDGRLRFSANKMPLASSRWTATQPSKTVEFFTAVKI